MLLLSVDSARRQYTRGKDKIVACLSTNIALLPFSNYTLLGVCPTCNGSKGHWPVCQSSVNMAGLGGYAEHICH